MKLRAEIYMCSYKTAYINWMTDEEKQGYSFEELTK
jgi:hypothetical protein